MLFCIWTTCVWFTHHNTCPIRCHYLKTLPALCLLSYRWLYLCLFTFMSNHCLGRLQSMVLFNLALLHGFCLNSKPIPSKNIGKPAFKKFSSSNRLHLQTNFTCLTRYSLHNMPFFFSNAST